jgi:hypothetical protein
MEDNLVLMHSTRQSCTNGMITTISFSSAQMTLYHIRHYATIIFFCLGFRRCSIWEIVVQDCSSRYQPTKTMHTLVVLSTS